MSEDEKNENQPPQTEAPKPAAEPQAAKSQESKSASGAAKPVEQQPKFENLKDEPAPETEKKKIDFLHDIELDVNIELGRAELRMREILSLQPGSVVELNRLAGDPVDIIINNRLVARGEVIVIDDNFAVRVTDILNPSEITATLASSM